MVVRVGRRAEFDLMKLGSISKDGILRNLRSFVQGITIFQRRSEDMASALTWVSFRVRQVLRLSNILIFAHLDPFSKLEICLKWHR